MYLITHLTHSILQLYGLFSGHANERADYFATHIKSLRTFSGSSARGQHNTVLYCTVLFKIFLVIYIYILYTKTNI